MRAPTAVTPFLAPKRYNLLKITFQFSVVLNLQQSFHFIFDPKLVIYYLQILFADKNIYLRSCEPRRINFMNSKLGPLQMYFDLQFFHFFGFINKVFSENEMFCEFRFKHFFVVWLFSYLSTERSEKFPSDFTCTIPISRFGMLLAINLVLANTLHYTIQSWTA